MIKSILKTVLTFLFKVEVKGLENYDKASEKTLIIANHTSFLDAVLLIVFLPGKPTFAINSFIAEQWYIKPLKGLVNLFPMDPTNPMSTKSLIKHIQAGNQAVIFPEGRITVTGSLMKIYDGPGLIATKSDADILPVRIEGAQYTYFSRMKGRLKLKLFPKISLTVLAPRKLSVPEEIRGRARRRYLGEKLGDIMTDMMVQTSHPDTSLLETLQDVSKIYGKKHPVVMDITRKPVRYIDIFRAMHILGDKFGQYIQAKENVGILLPNANANVLTLFAVQGMDAVPAMLNYTAGLKNLLSACKTAEIKTIISSKRFIEVAKLEDVVEKLSEKTNIVYLEDIQASVTPMDKLAVFAKTLICPTCLPSAAQNIAPDDAAVILFTSGSEGTPKGVVLSHKNLQANRLQLGARVDFTPQDLVLNALPMFHSFGLMAGTLLPILSGMRLFLYPSPLHYRIVPEMAYDVNATILFGTDTFLSGYARMAHPYDFYSVRYVFAGAEKLKEETRNTWSNKFGVRIFEGYGATETSPVLSCNTPMANKIGSVGKLLPQIETVLEPVPGVENGGRLHVKGPNIMKGYLLADKPGKLVSPESSQGKGWYDTGDIVEISEEGFVTIKGRAKRFAKIAGEMVSLTAVETFVSGIYPDEGHAIVALPDAKKGEQLVLLTTKKGLKRSNLFSPAKEQGISELWVPKEIVVVDKIPLLGTGKVDYVTAKQIAEKKC